ncbi:MAG: class I SAM-dependent methyltransferase, partial [Myxococcota bacterium]|nr:class I SAM-dependent methyltransferase [Myxococcota bacterium]
MHRRPPMIAEDQCHDFEVKDARDRIRTDERFWGIGGAFTYLICPHCRSWTLHPKPSDDVLSRHYEGYYPPEEYAQRQKQPVTPVERARARQVHTTLRSLDRLESVRTVLDVGTGCGGFLEAFRQGHEANVHGCDQDPASADLAESLFQIEVQVGVFDQLNYDEDQFELITLWHCFEHVRQPQETLRALKHYLHPNGTLLM